MITNTFTIISFYWTCLVLCSWRFSFVVERLLYSNCFLRKRLITVIMDINHIVYFGISAQIFFPIIMTRSCLFHSIQRFNHFAGKYFWSLKKKPRAKRNNYECILLWICFIFMPFHILSFEYGSKPIISSNITPHILCTGFCFD